MSGHLVPLLPAAVLLLFAAGAGSFYGAATFAGAVAGQAAVLALALVAGSSGDVRRLDPLRLGVLGRLLPAALLVAVAASWWASPVPRAGLAGVILLPAFLLLPAAVARAWESDEGRRWGLAGISAAAAVVALWALADRFLGGSPRAAMPLGHHTLLAAWLVAVLPLAALPLRRAGAGRLLAGVAVAAGVAAVAASGSLLGLAALGLQGLGAALLLGRSGEPGAPGGARRARWLVAGSLAVAALAVALPRLVAIAAGRDPSALARTTYARAGWDGFSARPLLGWGPGATPWTAGLFLDPKPGINPPGEVVGQLHSLPLQLLFELGATGGLLALAVVILFVVRRLRQRPASADPPLLGAALLALAGGGVTLAGSAPFAIPALPLALTLATGAALAAASAPRPPARSPRATLAVAGYVFLAALLLTPLDRAHRHYERARMAAPEQARRELAAAVELDPGFPLYRARWSWSGAGGPLGRRAAAVPARRAAAGAPGVGALWLVAGVYGLGTGDPWARPALARACELDPLAPLAPFYLAVSSGSAAQAAGPGARALLAEPRLAAAVFWEERSGWLAAAAAEVERWPGVDAGWRESFGRQLAALPPPERRGPLTELAWVMDAEGAESLSPHLFRRRPWPARLAPVAVRRDLALRISLPPAAGLPETAPEAFAGLGCGLNEG